MAIFNELATDLMILNEKKTQEEYARRRFKEKYNFEPDKPGSNTGTITDKAGKKYKVDMKPGKMDAGMGKIDIPTSAEIYGDNAKDSKINIDKNFFKVKGSHKGERRDAMLQHEIGHQNLHNAHAENKTVDKKNRTMEVYKNVTKGNVKDNSGADISSDEDVGLITYDGKNAHEKRKEINDQGETAKHYAKKLGSKEERKQRNADLEVAKHYEKKSPHANAAEYEADRFAANRTSERAIKKGVRNAYKLARKDYDKTFDAITGGYGTKDSRKEFKKDMNNTAEVDMRQRSKALKDDAMRKAKSYK